MTSVNELRSSLVTRVGLDLPSIINKAEAARGILNNFEILLAVLFPNTTTSRTITYTNFFEQFFKVFF